MERKHMERLREFSRRFAVLVGAFLGGYFGKEINAGIDLILTKLSDVVALLLSFVGVI